MGSAEDSETGNQLLKLMLIVGLAVLAIDLLIFVVQDLFQNTIYPEFQVLLPVLSLLFAVQIYYATADANIKFLMKILSVGLVTSAISNVCWNLVPLVVQNSFVQSDWFYYLTQAGWLFSYALIAYGLIKLKNSRQWMINPQIDRLITVQGALAMALLFCFIVLNLRFDNPRLIDIAILAAYLIGDVIILTMALKLINMNLRLEVKFLIFVILVFFTFNTIGDIIYEMRWLVDVKYLLTIFYKDIATFIYNTASLLMTSSLFVYCMEPFKIWAMDEIRKTLKDTQIFVDDLIAESPDATCIFDKDGRLILVNDAFLLMFRLTRGSIDNSFDIYTQFVEGSEDRQLIADAKVKVRRGETVIIPRFCVSRPDNPDLYVYLKLFHTNNSEGQISGYVLIIEDITERVKLERDLLEAYSSLKAEYERKVDFTNAMAHELRTPLTPIIGYTEIIKAETADEKHKNYLEIIERNALKQKDIVNRMLELASLDAGMAKVTATDFEIEPLLAEIVDNYRTVNPSLSVDLPPGLLLHTDRDILRNLLDNLISNAIKYSDPGQPVHISVTEEGPDYLFLVRDEGIGIQPRYHERIFDRFYIVDGDKDTRLTGRVGLGLTLVKGYLTLLGGKVWLESEPGKGSTFYFTIPKVSRE